MQPFDYSGAATAPFALAFQQGLGAAQDRQFNAQTMGLRTAENARAETAFGQQNVLFDQGQQDRASAMQAAEEQALAQAQQQAAMQADLGALAGKISSGAYTFADFAAVTLKYPELATELKGIGDGMSAERKQADTAFAVRAISAIKAGQPQIAAQMLEDRAIAAENAGDQQEADLSRAAALLAQSNPEAAVAQLGLTLAVISPDTAKLVLGEDKGPLSPEGKLAADLAAGRITQAQFDESSKPAGPLVQVNPGGDKFEEEFAKGDAKALLDVATAGLTAQRNLGRIDALKTLLASSPTGLLAILAQKAGEYGINTNGLDALQAAQAAVNALVPEQHVPGSGPMSDADLALFKESLPRLINQPGGNAIILQTMRGIAEYDAAGAEIVQRLRAGEITRADAFKFLQDRPNPLEGVIAPADAAAGSSGSQRPAEVPTQAEADALLREFGATP